MATKRPTQPQDYKKPATKKKKQEMHDPSEMFTFTSEFSNFTIEVPYLENLPGRVTRIAMEKAGDTGEAGVMLAMLEELLGDEYENTIDSLLHRELGQFITEWQKESVIEPGE